MEGPTQEFDEGLARLKRILSEKAPVNAFATQTECAAQTEAADTRRLEELCDTVVATLLPDREKLADDAAILIVRPTYPAAADIASHELPQDPQAAGQAREYVREQLAAWGLDELSMTTCVPAATAPRSGCHRSVSRVSANHA